jgi:hypothetical protein
LGYFWDSVSMLGQPGLRSSYLCFPYSWDGRYIPPCPVTGWDGVSQTFCPGWPQTSVFLSCWDYRLEPLCPAFL